MWLELHTCRQGAVFSKWRAAFGVSENKPSIKAIELNAEELASYAAISQVHYIAFCQRVAALHYLLTATHTVVSVNVLGVS
jgi:hypothetical protein